MSALDKSQIQRQWFIDDSSFQSFLNAMDKAEKIANAIKLNDNYIATIHGESIEKPSIAVHVNGNQTMICLSGIMLVGDTHCLDTGKIIVEDNEINDALKHFSFYQKINVEDII